MLFIDVVSRGKRVEPTVARRKPSHTGRLDVSFPLKGRRRGGLKGSSSLSPFKPSRVFAKPIFLYHCRGSFCDLPLTVVVGVGSPQRGPLREQSVEDSVEGPTPNPTVGETGWVK